MSENLVVSGGPGPVPELSPARAVLLDAMETARDDLHIGQDEVFYKGLKFCGGV